MPLDPQPGQSLTVLPRLHGQGLHCARTWLGLALPCWQPPQPSAGQSLLVLPWLHGQGLHCPHLDLTLACGQHSLTAARPAPPYAQPRRVCFFVSYNRRQLQPAGYSCIYL
jgi:hypothetical protein